MHGGRHRVVWHCRGTDEHRHEQPSVNAATDTHSGVDAAAVDDRRADSKRAAPCRGARLSAMHAKHMRRIVDVHDM